MDITGKVAIVTGAAIGIGRAIAQRLAAAGASVVVADIDASGGERTAELIGPSARFVQVDMRDDDAVTELMACQPADPRQQRRRRRRGERGIDCWVGIRASRLTGVQRGQGVCSFRRGRDPRGPGAGAESRSRS
ncbi:SDR family NAD(P)-dependent oxidoreductase [Kribbella sp. NPDC058693]|uniref:SDR family NAD(P)-dependent oxidoreductase n=1 Tax=Kribbella sp. NPDC058693 TaxID=3346602 RepID=UPI003665E172